MPQITQAQAANKTQQASMSKTGQGTKVLESYKTETNQIKRLSQMANPQFAFKADSNELNENALARFLSFQNQK